LRRDVAVVLRATTPWEVFEAKGGRLTRLTVRHMPRVDVHSLWCHLASADPWTLELMLDESDGDEWVYRREPKIRRSLSEVARYSPEGLPYLAPEIQLLYKSKRPRQQDKQDFEHVRPLLDSGARKWLIEALELTEPTHPWIPS
jgi:hypothetical protein